MRRRGHDLLHDRLGQSLVDAAPLMPFPPTVVLNAVNMGYSSLLGRPACGPGQFGSRAQKPAMRKLLTVAAVLATNMFVFGQSQVPPRVACAKNISFAVAEGGQPVPAIPKFVSKWASDKKRQEGLSGVCFSQIPDGLARNYVVVFSTKEISLEGLTPIAHTYTRTTPNLQNALVTSSYGGTWDYSYAGGVAANTTATSSLQLMDKASSFFVRVYNQHGGMLSRYSVGLSVSRERMLDSAVDDIRSDSQPPPQQKPFAAPLSVYYVNCDVDAEANRTASVVSSESVPPASADHASKETAQESVLDFWSNPTGADILIDGAYVGKTPFSLKVTRGEHMLTIRKQDFTTWQRKLEVTAGKRRVAAYLEQKVLTLGVGLQ